MIAVLIPGAHVPGRSSRLFAAQPDHECRPGAVDQQDREDREGAEDDDGHAKDCEDRESRQEDYLAHVGQCVLREREGQ